MKRICLITPAHLAANPRLVREADALAEAGYEVQVCACQYLHWAREADRAILGRARWRADLLCWSFDRGRYLFLKSRFRRHVSRGLLHLFGSGDPLKESDGLALRAYDRVLPELLGRALRHPADLYIAHNLQALPVSVLAARGRHAKVGFDAEDLHSGMGPIGSRLSLTDRLTGSFERRYLLQCDYITAASPGIGEGYAAKYRLAVPVCILNVSPLSHRPRAFRVSGEGSPLTLYWFSQTIGARRGLEDVVRALGALRGRGIELHLRGNWQAGYQRDLLRLVESSGAKPDQIISHPPGPPDEMVRLASEFDVGLALEPGRDHNNAIALSNKLFTYLLAGNVVIATATKGQRSILERIGAAGFCYEPGDVKGLAARLKTWSEDRNTLERARREAWDWGTREFNWDLEKKKFLAVVEKALSTPRRRGCGPS